MKKIWTWLVAGGLAAGVGGAASADWATHRGNAQRTGAADDKGGPKAPKVLWVYESPQEHFIAAPVVDGGELYVSALSYGSGAFHALATEPGAAARVKWSKKPPGLKLPVVCAPAVADGRVVFGDGMHQTNGATLYCLLADGTPLWQLPVPGTLVHLEGAPTIAGGKVFIGGGAAGVICVDLNVLTLNGKQVSLAEVQQQVAAKWKQMQAAYEADKKKDPDFAIPPDENQLPKPQPKKLWQAGANQWHVDSAVAVAGDRVLVGSARLDLEKVGERAMFCVDAATGQPKWQTPLKYNPWAGPTVAGSVVLVGCSSIRFDPKEIPHAKGELVAVGLDDGKVLWRKDVPGGVVSSVAVAGDLAVFTATDGKVRAWNVKDGAEKWAYSANTAFFAGPAVGGGMAYAADLKGVIHAVSLTDGQKAWTLDLGSDPAVKAPGMVYGGPVLSGGRLFVATSNMESGANQQKTVVVCVGEK